MTASEEVQMHCDAMMGHVLTAKTTARDAAFWLTEEALDIVEGRIKMARAALEAAKEEDSP